jgi:hypothetical protein
MTIINSRFMFGHEAIPPMTYGRIARSADSWTSRRNGPNARLAALALAPGLCATAVCLGGEIWVVFRLLAVLPDSNTDPADIQRLADIGKWIAGATGATLLVRWFLDRAARAGRLGVLRSAALLLAWLVAAAAIYQSLQVITDTIVDSLPAEAQSDAVLIALYRKGVQDGSIGDPDFGPGTGGTLDDLQRVKAVNAAIGLLDRERDYAKRSETVMRDAAEARKAEIVAAGQRQVAALRAQIGAVIERFDRLSGSAPVVAEPDVARSAWSAYSSLWDGVAAVQSRFELTDVAPADASPPTPDEYLQRFIVSTPADAMARQVRERLASAATSLVLPPQPELGLEGLRLGDIPSALTQATFGRLVADSLGARRDSAVWTIEDKVLTALDAVSHAAPEALPGDARRKLVMSVVVPPLALSFGVIGIIANVTALILLVAAFGLLIARFGRTPLTRTVRTASVVLPWFIVAAAIFTAPPVPFSDGHGFSRIVQQAHIDPEGQVWTNLWLRMIGVEAELLGR